MALKIPIPTPGNLPSSSPTFTPGADSGPRSPGEAPGAMHTPDCPKTEAHISEMQKK